MFTKISSSSFLASENHQSHGLSNSDIPPLWPEPSSDNLNSKRPYEHNECAQRSGKRQRTVEIEAQARDTPLNRTSRSPGMGPAWIHPDRISTPPERISKPPEHVSIPPERSSTRSRVKPQRDGMVDWDHVSVLTPSPMQIITTSSA